MSGFHTPKWFDALWWIADKTHKVTHPSRWGEEKRWREEEERKLREKDEHEKGAAINLCSQPERQRDEHEDGGP